MVERETVTYIYLSDSLPKGIFEKELVCSAGENLESLLLNNKLTGLVTVVGEWSQLTGAISRTLIQWGKADEARGYSLQDESMLNARGPETTQGFTASVAVVERGEARVFTNGEVRSCPLPQIFEQQRSSTPPFALSITDHGAEHCIVLGDRWIVRSENMLQGALGLDLKDIASPVVFLHACGVLRLGDSAVPRRYSLAAGLAEAGVSVVGPIRIVPALPNVEGYFSHLVLAGVPLGRVANLLNIYVENTYGEPASFQVIGSADCCLRPHEDRTLPAAQSSVPHCIDSIRHLINRLNDCLKIVEDFKKFGVWQEKERHWIDKSYEAIRFGGLVVSARHRILGEESNAKSVYDILDRALRDFDMEFLEAISLRIAAGTWIGSLYAPWSSSRKHKPAICMRCMEPAVIINFMPLGLKYNIYERFECDRCGTVYDTIGKPQRQEVTFAKVLDKEITLKLPPRSQSSFAKVVVHRSGDKAGYDWPTSGGEIIISRKKIPFCGRVTLSAICVENGSLTALYNTVFLERFIN